MTNKKTLEILLVEDNEQFLNDAKKFMSERIKQGAPINVTYAETLDDAMIKLQTIKYDGIITDVFFPEKKGVMSSEKTIDSCKKLLTLPEKPKSYELVMKELADPNGCVKINDCGMGEYMRFKAVEDWTLGQDQAPLGILVSEYAFNKEIPCVLVTNAYHHGAKASLVSEYIREKNFELVDGYNKEDPHNGLSEKKNFQTGLFALGLLYEAKKEGIIDITKEGYIISSKAKELKSTFPDYKERNWSDPFLCNGRNAARQAVNIGIGFDWSTRVSPDKRDEYEKQAYDSLIRDMQSPVTGKMISSVINNYFPDIKLE